MKNIFSFIIFFLLLAAQPVFAVDLYWEEAEIFSSQGRFPVSAYSDEISVIAWQEVAPNRDSGLTASGFINVNLAIKETNGGWQRRGIVAGPYPFSGTEPSVTSLVIDNRGRIIMAVSAGGTQTEILISDNKGVSFTRRSLNLETENAVAPRIFVRADGGYLLFVSRGSGQSLTIYYSRSDDGVRWSPFEAFTPEHSLSLNFLPAHSSIRNTDIVFFQSLTMGIDSLSTFQLYYKTSEDGGRTWTEARRFTTFNDPALYTTASPDGFDNQRPHLTKYGNNLLLVWERRYSNQLPSIYCASINASGLVAGTVERVNSVDAYCNNPIAFVYQGDPKIVWFDNRSGNNRIILGQRGDLSWSNYPLSTVSMNASFARPAICHDGPYVFWQSAAQNTGRIYILAPDHSVPPPRISALNFTPSRANRSERARVAWNIPSDTSGILGFSWTWGQDPNARPAENVMQYNTGSTQNLNHEFIAAEDGAWYFAVTARDFAGNWSEPERVMYYRKNTPPPEVVIINPELDAYGFLRSNTFNMSWETSVDPYIAGYTWNLQYLGVNENAIITAPPPNIMGSVTSTGYTNQDDGIWAFSVAAIDQAGNIGLPSNITFRTNKFIPYTSVSLIDAWQDEQGILSMRILGRGFSTNGVITTIILEKDDKQYSVSEFTIRSDREIGGISLDNMVEGQYQIRLEHSSRGWYSANAAITTERTRTIKTGDYTREWKPSWIINPQGIFTINPVFALTALLIIFSALGLIVIFRGIGGAVRESIAIKQEAYAIITGDFMPMEKKQRIAKIEKRGRGLAFKLASFTIALVLIIVIMISIPMYINMTNTQRGTLLESLWDRSSVLLEGIISSTRTNMPMAIQSLGERGVLEMMSLPSQSTAIKEANYITITGYGIGSIHSNHVWASNDPDINSKIDTELMRPGVSRINDDLMYLFDELGKEIDSKAREDPDVTELINSINEMTRRAQTIQLDDMQRIMDIQVSINSQVVKLTELLTKISGEIGSYPYFSKTQIQYSRDQNYIFYKPIVYRHSADNNFFRGIISLEVSLDLIIDQITQGQIMLLQTIGIVALAALLIGIIGALTLAALIIRPVRKLVRHIEIIRDTEDKSKLAGVDINIKSRDEIAVLGNTINDMTHGLVKAALAASDLSIGKEIQKKFIPLEMDSHGNKQSSGFKNTPNLNFFGYYEGAKGVSGDYFDFKDLDGRYFAIIKCDVAGKGIPAALIMIQVATMFLNYFKQWKPNAKGMHIEEVVYQINDFIEALGFKGRFAAFTLCLFDSQTGIVRFCNAGDNIVRYYDASEGRLKTITLPQTPATGVLPNFMIESTTGYTVQTVQIDKGDILLLYTDGIEEAKRRFRDKRFKEIICAEGPADTPHENHLCGQADEELTPERVEAIINAVMAKEIYTLHKFHNPENQADGGGDLQFDFSGCEGRVEDVIMAMVSVEKMFRCYKPADAGEDSRVLVDKKVDEFLKNHFIQYRRYCSHTREYPENPAYMYYTHIKEDEQYDDLTILGINRKGEKK